MKIGFRNRTEARSASENQQIPGHPIPLPVPNHTGKFMKIKFNNHSWLPAVAILAALFASTFALRAREHPALHRTGLVAGMSVTTLPAGYVQTSANGVGFYYYNGVFYQPTTVGNYVVVAPPIDAVVPQLPDRTEAFLVGAATFYYAGGAFYLQQPNGFAVVPAPLGVTVPRLPAGSAPTVIDGVLYYLANNTYYLPIMQAGITVYVTAQP